MGVRRIWGEKKVRYTLVQNNFSDTRLGQHFADLPRFWRARAERERL